MSFRWLSIATSCAILVSSARPSASLADGLDAADDRSSRPKRTDERRVMQSVLQMHERYKAGSRGGEDFPKDPEQRAEAMKAACGRTRHEEIKLNDIRNCVEELQKYAQATREGFIESIGAEKVFVKEYKNAAQNFDSPVGRNKAFVRSQEHKNALTFLTDLASKVGEDARDLKVYKKLAKKAKATAGESDSGEGEDDEDGEDEDEDSDEGSGGKEDEDKEDKKDDEGHHRPGEE
eukprot:g8503.t1